MNELHSQALYDLFYSPTPMHMLTGRGLQVGGDTPEVFIPLHGDLDHQIGLYKTYNDGDKEAKPQPPSASAEVSSAILHVGQFGSGGQGDSQEELTTSTTGATMTEPPNSQQSQEELTTSEPPNSQQQEGNVGAAQLKDLQVQSIPRSEMNADTEAADEDDNIMEHRHETLRTGYPSNRRAALQMVTDEDDDEIDDMLTDALAVMQEKQMIRRMLVPEHQQEEGRRKDREKKRQLLEIYVNRQKRRNERDSSMLGVSANKRNRSTLNEDREAGNEDREAGNSRPNVRAAIADEHYRSKFSIVD